MTDGAFDILAESVGFSSLAAGLTSRPIAHMAKDMIANLGQYTGFPWGARQFRRGDRSHTTEEMLRRKGLGEQPRLTMDYLLR